MNKISLSIIIFSCVVGAFFAGVFVNVHYLFAVAAGAFCLGLTYYIMIALIDTKAASEMAAQEELLCDALAAAQIGYYRTDLSGNIVFRYGFENVLSISGEDISEDLTEHVFPSSSGFDKKGNIFEALRSDRNFYSFEVDFKSADQKMIRLEHTVILARDFQGKPSGCIGVVKNISEQRRLEDELEKERHYLNSVMDNSTDSVFFQDFDGRFLKVNKVFAEYAGASNPEACVGLSVHNFLSPQVANKVLQDISEVAASQSERRLVMPAVDSMGNKLRFDVRHCLHRGVSGNPEAIVGFARELDEHMENRIDSADCHKELQGLLSHELRTPVAGILGSLRVLEGEDMSQEAREYVAKCTLSAQRLKRTVNGFLNKISGKKGDIGIQEQTGPISKATGTSTLIENGLNVLLAEDDISSQVFMRRTLENWGCNVRTAENGSDVLKFLEEQECDLVLMDIHMPEMTGYEAIARIREMESPGKSLPIIVMSAYRADSDQQKMDEFGVAEFIAKPVRSEILKAAIDKIFS